ncbi:MAG: restriction endonuclease [bacterium]
MNEWVKMSIEIANAPGYLDKLHQVYPVIQESEREIEKDIKSKLKKIYNAGNDAELIKELLNLPKFPVKDPYVAFLRKREVFIEYNPKTVQRIAKRIHLMGYNAMIESIEEPKEFNRQIGTLFKRWLPKIGYPILSIDDFGNYDSIAFLQGSDAQLKDFSNTVLGCDLDKGPDFLAKVGKRYVIGEAKFLTDYGGHQNAQFEDALRLLRGKKGRL